MLLLVRYGEIGLKSASVRRRFEQQLVSDIRRRHALQQLPCVITQARGRLYVDSNDWRRSCEILSRTFGVVSFSPVQQVTSELDDLTKAVVESAGPLLFKGATFAIRTRRSGNHPYTSQSLAKSLGAAVLERYQPLGIKVDLGQPDVEIFVEVRDRKAHLFNSTLQGPGGMPLGSQGKVLSVVDSKEAVASTWLLMKRGCSVLVAAKDPSYADPLDKWYPYLKRLPLDVDDLFALAEHNECIGIGLPWSLKEIEERGALKGQLPVFYPLVGMSGEEVRSLLERVVRT